MPSLQSSVAPGRRLQGIDALRGMAVILVLFRHLTYTWPGTDSGMVWDFVHVVHRGGWIGVDLFFVLSGFLVSGLLFKEYIAKGEIDVWRFLIRRGFKIYPSFWILILTTVGVNFLFQVEAPKRAILSELAFLQNYGQALWNHTWTLAVEEHFYIGLVLLVYLLVRFKQASEHVLQSIPAVALTVMLVTLLNRSWNTLQYPWSFKTNVFVTHMRVDSLMFGVLLSWFFWFRGDDLSRFVHARRGWLLFGGIALLIPPFVWPLEESRVISSIGFSALYLGAGMLLLLALYHRIEVPFVTAFLSKVGFYSYSIYLWHMLVFKWLVPRIGPLFPGWNFSWHVLLCLAGSLSFGLAAARLVELPALKIRDSYFPSRATRRSGVTHGKSPSQKRHVLVEPLFPSA